MKKDKPHKESQPVIYHPLMDMLEVKTSTFLQFDVMNDRINDCFEILVIIAHVSLDIH